MFQIQPYAYFQIHHMSMILVVYWRCSTHEIFQIEWFDHGQKCQKYSCCISECL